MAVSKSQLHHWAEFLFAMTEKEIKARYKFAWLGFLWIILNPLLQMLVIGFVFQFFVPVRVDNYFLFLFAGLLPWNFFSLSLTKTTPSIVFERALIKKAMFPREAIILSIILSNLFHFVISLLLVLVFSTALTIYNNQLTSIHITETIFRIAAAVLAVGWVAILTSGLSLITAALNVKFRDVNFMIQAVMPLWFYATPVVYTLDLLPRNLIFLAYLNPMTAVIELFQYSVVGRSPENAELWLISLLFTAVVIVLGGNFFQKESRNFDDWV
ncbi:MAG: ABC transporter permease [bacterium]|nr:ABC transporter permease [bacterium]